MKPFTLIRIIFSLGIFLLATNLRGQLIELNRINFSDSLSGIGANFYRVNENHYLFSGMSNNWEARIMDCDSNGTINWLYQIPDSSRFLSIIPAEGACLALLARNQYSDNPSLEIHKIALSGVLIDSLILIPNMSAGQGEMIRTQDGNIVVTGSRGIMSGESVIPQGYLAKINSELELLWSTEEGLDNTIFYGGITENPDGSLAFCSWDRIIVSNAEGELLDTLPLPFSENGLAETIISTEDAGYLVGGWELHTDPNSFYLTTILVKTDASGAVLWTFEIDSTNLVHAQLDQVGSHYLFSTGDMLYSFVNDSIPEWSQSLSFMYSTGHLVGQDQYVAYGIGFTVDPFFFGNQLAVYQLPFNTDIVTGQPVLPIDVRLFPAYPNPFNPSTTIEYELPHTEMVDVSIYDLQGRLISNLTNQVQPAGRHNIPWNGRDHSGHHTPSGIYICKLTTPGFSQTQKLIVLK